ncbi:MAG: acyl-CoA transferase [Alphaproteobacteria bacterium]|nr:MAG: acyl-CoA transferase [Alphaproteobacteria bacterium]
MTTRETVLQALFEQLQTIVGPKVLRNDVLPEKVPAGGLLILRDGDPGEPETLLSPLSYYWEHHASLEVLVQAGEATQRDQIMDALFQNIADAVAADPTLGGLCDRATPLAADTSSVVVEGAGNVKAAIVPIELIYTTTSQLG